MDVKQTVFIKSAVKPSHYPDLGLPEVAFAGRSNVGKSSLINRLLNRRSLVRVSSTPGRTQHINFFTVNDQLALVDLPGYGFAKAPVAVRRQWGPMIESYLQKRQELKAVVWILDCRRKPNQDDLNLAEWLLAAAMPIVTVATKVDKIKPSVMVRTIKEFRAGLPPQLPPPLLFSSRTGRGRSELWSVIESYCLPT